MPIPQLRCLQQKWVVLCGSMSFTVELPDSVAEALRLAPPDAEAEVRKELALALYARGILGFGKATLRQTLDNGEAEAIALATELHPESVLLDDKLARQMARRLGVPVTGTIGVLLRAKQVGLIVEVRSQSALTDGK